METSVTVRAPVNIAVIKYWGKSDEAQILPINSSLSATLNMDELCTTTTITASPSFTEDSIILNGNKDNINAKRLQNCLQTLKFLAKQHKTVPESLLSQHIQITTSNNFPTAAGLASSASGFAALTFALSKLYHIEPTTTDLTQIARVGSGSACRSLAGGFVQWHKGDSFTNQPSSATQVLPHTHWPELVILVCIVNDKQKETPSTVGMQRSVHTSDLIVLRDLVTQKRIEMIRSAIQSKNFAQFAEITMKDSNQFHAICLDTYPPIKYMNEVSFEVVRLVHLWNELQKEVQVGYTFDAGPNAVLFLERKNLEQFLKALVWFFPSKSEGDKVGEYVVGGQREVVEGLEVKGGMGVEGMKRQENGVLRSILVTSVGRGPEVVEGTDKGAKL
eukprot:TRINITY_DN3715_c0_g1_i1.p1 TRINITY_DN3715_c0_g1~~TRINITY_DN3715_c0_g1_i1.p1  ORF type:complete len:390 (-),score=108.47 TRINITY_DN3715_c0_g1_i1:64-1233(-)